MCADKATACAARRCEKTFVSCRLVLPSTNANTAGARRCGGVFALPCAFCCRCVVNHTCRRSCARNGPPTAPPNHAQLPSQAKGKPYMRNRLCKPEISPGVCHGERRRAESCDGALCVFFTAAVQFWQLAGRNRPCGRLCAQKGPPTAPLDRLQPPLQARGKPWWMQWGAQASGGAFCL